MSDAARDLRLKTRVAKRKRGNTRVMTQFSPETEQWAAERKRKGDDPETKAWLDSASERRF